jgi:UDP-glucose 4-epimerase
VSILLTGATGYVGSHLWIELLRRSFEVVGVDNLSNSSKEICGAIEKISSGKTIFFRGDVRDADFLSHVFSKHSFTHVIHLAALKNVQESLINKDEYFDVNVNGLKTLLTVMRTNGCQKIIFSSSAAVYGSEAISPISEFSKLSPVSWYGITKLQGEQLLSDSALTVPPINAVSLRYFNVAGKHASGLLAKHSLMSSQSLFGQIERTMDTNEPLSIFGDDWDTCDGTCVRDYVHVSDIVKGHIDALSLLDSKSGFTVLNLGSGKGESVKEVVSAIETVIGRSLPIKITGRRAGDVATSYADCSRAQNEMGWVAMHSLSDMCSDLINTHDI